jgi:predicted TIM-barrel fold metal-dependent hydrolase
LHRTCYLRMPNEEDGLIEDQICIDVHTHWKPPSWQALALEYSATDPEFAALHALLLSSDSRLESLDVRVAGMDESGVDISALSLAPPAASFGGRDVARRVAQAANDEFLDAAERYPGRFQALLALPLPYIDDALAELDRVGSHPAVGGISALTMMKAWRLDDPEFEPLYRRAAELGLPVALHPLYDPVGALADSDWGLVGGLTFMVNSSFGIARLFLSGMLDRVPELEIIAPHLGGTLPFLAQRLQDQTAGAGAHDPMYYLRERMHFDTCSFHAPALQCVMDTVGSHRLVLGSDCPFRGPLTRAVDHIVESVADADARAAILGGNAARWFGPSLG